MRVLLTGAAGYLGHAVGRALLLSGHEVLGLARSDVGAKTVAAAGMSPIRGDLANEVSLVDAVADVDAVIEAASADNHDAVRVLVGLLAGSGKRYIRTSGIGIYSEPTMGAPGTRLYAEDTPFTPHDVYLARRDSDDLAIAAAAHGVHSVVLRPGMVYGAGGSEHVPVLLHAALRDGLSRYVGDGRNQYGTVYLDDVAAGYVLALEHAPAGSVYNLSSGESTFGEIADGVAAVLGLEPAMSVSIEEAIGALGPLYGMGIAVAARADSARAISELGWRPIGPTLLEDLTEGSYRRVWGHRIPTVRAA